MRLRCYHCKTEADEENMVATRRASASHVPAYVCQDQVACQIRVASSRRSIFSKGCPRGHPASEVYRRRTTGVLIYCKVCKRNKRKLELILMQEITKHPILATPPPTSTSPTSEEVAAWLQAK